MKSATVCLLLTVGATAGLACGGSTTVSGDAGSSGSGASSGSGGSGAGGSGMGSSGVGSSGGGGSGAGSGMGGSGNGAPAPVMNDCPNCPNSLPVCCLAPAGGQVQGTCAATAAACPGGSASLPCMQGSDCSGGQQCCVTVGTASTPSSTTCAASCPAASPPACGGSPGDNGDCPGGSAGWECRTIPGTPDSVVGICVAVAIPDSGTGVVEAGAGSEAGAVGGSDAGAAPDSNEASTPPAEAGSLPQDAATGG